MLRFLDSASDAFVASMDQINQRMERAQRQLSTGLRVSSISDEPDSVSHILQARADSASNDQLLSNLVRVKTETDAGEQALQSAIGLIERARVDGTQGLTITATSETRQALASNVSSAMERLVGLARTAVNGRFIFSGDADQTAPYTIDLTANPPISVYAGSAATRQIQHPDGTRFTISKSAQEIFDSSDPTRNVYNALNNLRVALQANDSDAISAALPAVGTALDHLNSELAFYGGAQNKVADATSFGTKLQLQIKTRLSSLQDADLTAAIVDLNQAQLQQNVTLQARAKVPRTSLFDFLG